MEPDDKEAAVTQAEHRIKLAVQRDADERWRNRMDKENRITTNTIEALRSEVTRLSAQLSEEVVCMRSRQHGSAASTVAASTEVASAWGTLQPVLVQNTFVASRIELSCWRNIRATGITLDEAKQLISETKTRIKPDDLKVFVWDLAARDQGNIDIKMMVFLWFKEVVTSMVRNRVQLDLQQALAIAPIKFRDVNVRTTLELQTEKRPWNKAQAISLVR